MPAIPLTEDPDDEDHLSIPVSRTSGPGKPRTRSRPQDESDDDDCVMLEITHDTPLACADPLPPPPAAPSTQAATRKRVGAGTSAADNPGAKKAKITKKPSRKKIPTAAG